MWRQTMKVKIKCGLLVLLLLGGCGSHVKSTQLSSQDLMANEYIAFSPPPLSGWYFRGKPWVLENNGKEQFATLNDDSSKGVTYEIEIQTSSYAKGTRTKKYFNKNSKYHQILRDEDMELDENEREHGISYVRGWVNYVQGLKCTGGVFSRSPIGMMKGMSSKNYSFSCGYYDKVEGKRILSVSYSYRYAGGSTRHQKGANTPQSELISLKQAELGLKQAVKQLVSTIKIKNLDSERMEREGLMHYDNQYEVSPF